MASLIESPTPGRVREVESRSESQRVVYLLSTGWRIGRGVAWGRHSLPATADNMEHPGDAAVPVPYTSRLGQTVQAGQTLNIHGTFHPEAKRATVNLLSGAPEIGAGQAVLHLDIRFDEKKIVLNSYTAGAWGKEERESNPFKAGNKFDIRIRVLEDHLEITCDGKKVHDFKHRMPFESMEFFQVTGDVSLTGIHWGGRFYNLPWETGFPHGGLQGGQRIFVYGVPKGKGFSLDLLARNGDTLFHFNPRFDEKKVVRNSCSGGTWSTEEREGAFPFQKEKGFDLTILNEPYSIQIFVDNERFGTFQHRTANPVGDYVGMRIQGEVEITGIEFSH